MSGRPCIAVVVLLWLSTGCARIVSEPPQGSTPWAAEPRYMDVLCPTDNEQALQYYNAAGEHSQKGEWEEAKALYLKAVELDRDFCDAWDNLGLMYRTQGDIEHAIDCYRRSVAILPENPAAHMNLGVAYQLEGRFSDAMAEYEYLIEIAPDSSDGYYGLGQVLAQTDRCDAALAPLEEAERIRLAEGSPWLDHARYHLGVCHYELGNYVRARDYLEQIYASFEDDPVVNYYLGICYLSSDIRDTVLATTHLRRAEALGIQIPPEVSQQLGP